MALGNWPTEGPVGRSPSPEISDFWLANGSFAPVNVVGYGNGWYARPGFGS
ncbi:hypothetical protein SAMN05216277_11745 [Halolamina pelagica]|uniref:Uncharacterized protein n=1 Tax=Halolamina pelagica TaxID=699431 RepID=A0A1I5VE06_9EURY|nr:hypothetical protein SAMN05216277_11745 [Halolamina pelagica]